MGGASSFPLPDSSLRPHLTPPLLPLTPPLPLLTPPLTPPLLGAALIAGGAIGLLSAVLLVLLLIHRMKKKDEGSYDLGRKPIYTKAPTTEIYA